MTGDRNYGPSASRIVFSLLLFGLSFGYVEGAVVVFIRALYEPIHERLHPDRPPGDLFPLITLEELRREDPAHAWRLHVELVREAATLVMLAAVPWTFARNFREWIAGFMIGFGVWDIAYYATLKGWLGWPESLLTWDILFLIPVPWAGPILAPILVSASIIGAGLILLRREEMGRPVLFKTWHWSLIVLSGSIVIGSFCWEAPALAGGATPRNFPWWVFAAGEGFGLASFAHACLSPDLGSI